MGTVSTTLPSDGQTIDASDVNTPINAILSEFNGNIDDNNIKTGANINGAKIGAGTLPGSSFDSTIAGGWLTGALPAVSSVAYNGNRSYDITFASTVASILSSGMRLRTTRTVAAPTQCTSLNGTTQYYSKASPNKLTFTDSFTVSAWVKLSSYTAGFIMSRYDGTTGWFMDVNASGQVRIGGAGTAGAIDSGLSYQSLPLNKWVNVTATLSMSTTTAIIYFDGVVVPNLYTNGAASALIQAGSLNVGAANGASFFPGKIAQAAVFNAVLSAATIKAMQTQGLTGSETNLASAYSFNNSITDLNTTNPNDLTANGSAVATNADSPFGNAGTSSTLDYALVQSISTTTATVQVPEGCTIPTSGGVTSVAYSVQGNPFGWVSDKGRWRISSVLASTAGTTSNATFGAFISGGWSLTVPVGGWSIAWVGSTFNATTTVVYFNASASALTGLTAANAKNVSPLQALVVSPSAATTVNTINISAPISNAVAATYVMYTLGATTSAGIATTDGTAEMFAEPSNL